MKIIDLLNKIANEEEVPKKIKFRGTILDYEHGLDYIDENGRYLFSNKCCITKEDLNNEVEIIEEEKNIPEKLSTWFSVEISQNREDNIDYANVNFKNMYDKINEICDYLKSKGDE